MMKNNLALYIALVIACAALPVFAAGPKPFSAFDRQAGDLLAQMTLDEKIGQMMQPDQRGLTDAAGIEKYFLGSLLSGGSSDPETGNLLEDWTDMYDRYQARSLQTRLRIPLLYGVDAVHGHNNVIGAVVFPHNIGLGCTRNPKLVEQVARITAEEMRATGIQWTFAPCVAVPQDIRWGRTYEGYSESPDVVKELGAAAVRGYQGLDLGSPLSVLATAKHYAGDGGTSVAAAAGGAGSFARVHLDQGDTRVDEATLRRIHLPGYISAIQAGAGAVMPSFSSWNGVKCSASKRLLTEILKQELGFEGFLISDFNALDQLPGDRKSRIETSINAGMDMVMMSPAYQEFAAALKELVAEGKVPMSRIDDAVRRILRVKFAMGLIDKNRSQLADRRLWKSFGSAEHRQVAREAVRQSLVLLKNENSALPLSKTVARIHVAGKSADNIGIQCGGWTIAWAGQSGSATTGTTIVSAIQRAVSKNTQVTYSLDGSGARGADVGVAVVGELPYAEGTGDRADLTLPAEDVAAIRFMKAAGVKKIVVVLISGRPMIVTPVLDQVDALVAAWLPGTEGQGVSDVLFGDYKPAGKLSFSWPRSMAQVPINIHSAEYDPLFKLGFGLTY